MNFVEYYFTEKKKKKKKRPNVNVFPANKFNLAFFNPKKYDKDLHGTLDFQPVVVGE